MATINVHPNQHNNKIRNKILSTLKTNKFNPEIVGERYWYNYYLRVSELVWARNLIDGYKIEVFAGKYGEHLGTFELNYENVNKTPNLITKYVNEYYL